MGFQLQLKHVQINSICLVCENGVETIVHALIECNLAAGCWDIFCPDMQSLMGMDFFLGYKTSL